MVNVDQLRAEVREHRRLVVPFVGSGIALDAGAPRADQLAGWLSSRFGTEISDGSDLLAVTAALIDERGEAVVQAALAEHLAGFRMQATPTLTAVGACPRRVVVTTNYDDAIEVAARARGVQAVSLLADDPQILQPPKRGTMHVIHAHGVLDRPETLILPGRQMARLADDSPFVTFMRSTLASGHVLYLGFSLAAAEVHLRGIVQWLDARVAGAPMQWLLLPAREAEKRADELNLLAVTRVLSLVTFDASCGYGPVEDVALQLAPRLAEAQHDEDEADRMTWVQPVLYQPENADDPEDLARRLRTFDFGSAIDDPVYPEDLPERDRSVLVGGPGTGKTTLLQWLPRLTERAVALGTLRDFFPTQGTDPTRALLRLLRDADGRPVSAELWAQEGLVVALDGLEEVDADLRPAAVGALAAAADGRRHLLVAARPTEQLAALRDAGFDVIHVVPSHRWARRYLQTRAVPPHRVERVLLRDHGLGELLTVPVYAGLLADALLDDAHAELSPLRLLVDAQERAIAEEARRVGEPAAVLSRWARDLALGLQLTGRTSVPLSSLTEPGDDEQHRRLVAASVLGDVAGHAAFIRRTSQEALVADEILAAADTVGAFRLIAVGDVGGHDCIRADFDLVADLVFEHADQADRPALLELDEFRWARTALGSDDIVQAERALDVLERWHADRDVDWLRMFRRDGLRTASGAVSSLLARWPSLGSSRRDRWRQELRRGSIAARRRAVTALAAASGEDDDWLLEALADTDPGVQAQAALAAAQRGARAVSPLLLELLSSADATVSRAALVALVELLPAEELDLIARPLRGSDPLRPVYERLEERIDLDAGLRLLAARDHRAPCDAWLLDRLVARAPTLAWTPARAAMLMNACGQSGAGSDIDTAAVAAVVERQPDAALGAVRLTYVHADPPRWRGAPLEMCVLAQVPAQLLERHEQPDRLKEAMRNGLDEINEIATRQSSRERTTHALENAIDTDPDAIDLRRILSAGLPLRLDEARMQALRSSLRRRWPPVVRPLDAEEAELLLEASAAVQLPLAERWWLAAVEAHLGFAYSFGLGSDRIGWWLGSVRPVGVEPALLRLIARTADDRLPRVTLLSRLGPPMSDSLREAILARLRGRDPAQPWWRDVARHLIGAADASADWELIALAGASPAADELRAELARSGDERAAVDLIARLTVRLRAGEPFTRPWLAPNPPASPERVEALATLAESVLDGPEEALSWAVGSLQQAGGPRAVGALTRLATMRPALWWLASARDDAAQVLAAELVRERLPGDVRAAAAVFASHAR